MNARLKLVKLDPTLPTPKYAHDGDSGIDLYSAFQVTIPAGESAVIACGVAIELAEGFEGQLRGRSGLNVNHSIICPVGTIDNSYRGEIKAKLYNLGKHAFTVQPGDRICQLVVAPVARADIQVVSLESLSDSPRGRNGFGSTGLQ